MHVQAKALDASRLAAFALRLAEAAHFLDAPGALGALSVLERLLRRAPGHRPVVAANAPAFSS